MALRLEQAIYFHAGFLSAQYLSTIPRNLVVKGADHESIAAEEMATHRERPDVDMREICIVIWQVARLYGYVLVPDQPHVTNRVFLSLADTAGNHGPS